MVKIDMSKATKGAAIILGKDEAGEPFSLILRTEERAKKVGEQLARQGCKVEKVFASHMFQRGDEKTILTQLRALDPPAVKGEKKAKAA